MNCPWPVAKDLSHEHSSCLQMVFKYDHVFRLSHSRFREEVMDHELSKRKCARLTAEYEKKEVVYILKRNDEKLTEAKNDIESMR